MIKSNTILFTLVIAALSLPAWAQPEPAVHDGPSYAHSSRQGLYLSGIGSLGSELLQTKRLSVGAGMRIGGGITENFVLYVEGRGGLIDQSSLRNLLLFDAQLKGQYYFWDGLYANLGAGIATGRVQTLTLLLSSIKTGFGISGGVGYEFRVGKRFFVAPEMQVRYHYIGSTHYLSPAIGGQLGWHF